MRKPERRALRSFFQSQAPNPETERDNRSELESTPRVLQRFGFEDFLRDLWNQHPFSTTKLIQRREKMARREFLQLAKTYSPDKNKIGGWCVSEKLDGTRCFWERSSNTSHATTLKR